MFSREKAQEPLGIGKLAQATEYQPVSNEEFGLDRVTTTKLEKMRAHDLKMKRIIHLTNMVSRVLSVILSAWMVGAESYSLYQYETTRNRILASGGSPWPTPTVLWPTYLVIAMSSISFILNFCLVISPFCMSKERRKRSEKAINYTSYTLIAGFLITWAVTTGLFQMANTGSDLWGYTCDASDAVTNEVQSFLNFGNLCLIQGGAWDSMIIHTCVYAVTLIVYILIGYRYVRKRQMRKLEMNIASSQAF